MNGPTLALAAAEPNASKPVPWLYLKSGVQDPSWNMAFDEALLESMPALGKPVLRFYGWTQPAATFGYFQHYADVEQLTPLRPIVRRPTAGGIVPHDADWTYSLAFPTTHEWYGIAARESYCRLHLWVKEAFRQLNEATELAPAYFKPALGQCFVGHEEADLLWHGRKIAGAAQRRRKDGLLIQGSVQPPVASLARNAWEQAMLDSAVRLFGTEWQAQDDSILAARAAELCAARYSRADYNQRR